MPATFQLDPPSAEESLLNYPPEKRYLGWGTGAAVSFHVLVVSAVLALAYVNHIRSLRDLMTASMPQLPPDEIPIVLIDDKKEPPPTNDPLWINQIIIPKDKPPPPPPPPPPPKPKPKPQVVHFVPKISPGARNLPQPSYPMEAYRNRIQGTVVLRVSFDGTGGVSSVDVISSSGSGALDNGARHDILSRWHAPEFAGQTQDVPIRFQLQP